MSYNESLLEAVLRSCSLKKFFLNFARFTAKNLCLRPATLFKKRLCYRCLKFEKPLRTPFSIEHFLWLLLVFYFKLIFPSFYIKMARLYEFYKTSSFADFFLGFTKLNPKAVPWMCSIKKLFLEINCKVHRKHPCQSLFLNNVAAFRPINSIIK